MTMQDADLTRDKPTYRDVLERFVAWYEGGAKDEIDNMYSIAYVHGFRSHWSIDKPNLEQLMAEAKALLEQ